MPIDYRVFIIYVYQCTKFNLKLGYKWIIEKIKIWKLTIIEL